MKGQTIIELNNIKTGQKERYVDNNMVTNALTDYFGNCGLMNTLDVSKDSLVIDFLGGLLLFDDNIQENANNIFPPSAINMIGNGANGILSSDNVTEMGSYNSAESGWQSDGSYVQVWDYTTSQANGTIACASLTSKVCGYMGWGNSTSNLSKATNLYTYTGSPTIYRVSTNNEYSVLRTDYTNSVIYLAKISQFNTSSEDYIGTTKKLNIEVRNIPLNKLNLKTTTTSLIKERDIVIDIPNSFNATSSIQVAVGSDGEFYLYNYSQYWNNNIARQFLKVNVDNTTEVISVTNTTGNNFYSYGYFSIMKGKVIIQNYNSPYNICIIDMTSNEVKEIAFSEQLTSYTNKILNLGDYMLFVTSTKAYIIDILEGTFKNANSFTSSNFPSVNDIEQNINMLGTGLIKCGNYYYNQNRSIYISRIPLYLATINNLETPVVKTPEKTMKVTYRLTF